MSPSRKNVIDDVQEEVRELKHALNRLEQDRRGRVATQGEVMAEMLARQAALEEK